MGKVTDPIAKRIRKKAAKDIKGGFFGKITHYIPGWHGYQESRVHCRSASVGQAGLREAPDDGRRL
ncbi:MAG: hypothetical protein ACXABE_07105 [Candidatus Thorarchaeota archaeon]|jgi:hypothetical protein